MYENRSYFVPGMPVVLSQQVPGVHESWKMKNGRRGIAHSFSYKDKNAAKIPAAAFTPEGHGKEFLIPQPDFFNVLACDMPGEKPAKTPVIVPVPLAPDGGQGFIYYIKRIKKYNDSKAKLDSLTFAVYIGYAMTFEKIQGATLDRVILVISDLGKLIVGELKLQKLFVAFSRVRQLAHLAIFPAAARDLAYLTKMKYDEDLRLWAKNYDEDGFWKPDVIIGSQTARLFDEISPPQL